MRVKKWNVHTGSVSLELGFHFSFQSSSLLGHPFPPSVTPVLTHLQRAQLLGGAQVNVSLFVLVSVPLALLEVFFLSPCACFTFLFSYSGNWAWQVGFLISALHYPVDLAFLLMMPTFCLILIGR